MDIHVDQNRNIRLFSCTNGDKEQFPLFTLGRESYINGMSIQGSPGNEVHNIHIGNYCSIAYNVQLLINRNHDFKSVTTAVTPILGRRKMSTKQKGQIIIGHDVWVGNNAIILSGVEIGNGAVIGAGAVVTKNIPPYAIAVGNPIQIKKYRFTTEQIKNLLKIQWWNWPQEKIEKYQEQFTDDIDEFIKKFYFTPNPMSENLTIQKKEHSILLIPDFNEQYSIWERVIKEYIQTFTCSDDVTLVMWIPHDEYFENNIEKLVDFAPDNEQSPHILILDNILEDTRSLFKDMDYFIPTRMPLNMKYIEYAHEFDVNILSGVDIPIFDQKMKAFIKFHSNTNAS